MIAGLLGLAAVAYAAAWLAQLRSFRDPETPSNHAFAIAAAGVVAHFVALLAFGMTYRTPPLSGFGPAAASLSFVSAVVLLVLTRRAGGGLTGLFALPPITMLVGAALVAGAEPAPLDSGFTGAVFVLHVSSVLIGYAMLLLGSVAAAMYLLQFRALKRKEFGNVFRSFPSLDTLDRTSAFAVGAGLVVLTVGLVAGWSFTVSGGRGFAVTEPDVAFGLLTWAAYAAALGVRWTPGGRGGRAARLTVLAFAVSASCFVLLRAFTPTPELFL